MGGPRLFSWERRYRWRHSRWTSLSFWPSLALAAALACIPFVRRVGEVTDWAVFRYSPDGARAILGALAGSMLTFMVFVLSSLLIVVQLASAQLTPRIIAFVFAMPRIKGTLSLFTFTFAFTLSALARADDPVPHLHVSAAIVLNLICIVGFFRFVEKLGTGLRPVALMRDVASRGVDVIRAVYPQPFDPSRTEIGEPLLLDAPGGGVIEALPPSGVMMAFGAAELVELARAAGAVVEIVPQVGDFVAAGDPLLRVVGGVSLDPARLLSCVVIGEERTLEQDPRFAFRMLVDIAIKALSPAINDPTTAVIALDQVHRLLLFLGRRRLDSGRVYDREGKLRLAYGTPDWPDYVLLAASEIRHCGASSIQVVRRLRAMLEHLVGALPEDRHAALREELRLLTIAVQRGFPDDAERLRAEMGDYQGVGGSDPEGQRTPRRPQTKDVG